MNGIICQGLFDKQKGRQARLSGFICCSVKQDRTVSVHKKQMAADTITANEKEQFLKNADCRELEEKSRKEEKS